MLNEKAFLWLENDKKICFYLLHEHIKLKPVRGRRCANSTDGMKHIQTVSNTTASDFEKWVINTRDLIIWPLILLTPKVLCLLS